MAFLSTIVVVEDVLKSRTLYENVLKCVVAADFGIYNVGFAGGLSLYKKTLFEELSGGLEILKKANNFVLYFEVDGIEALELEIEKLGFAFVHKLREQPWCQRIFRFYDYDDYIVEIGENMTTVIRGLRDSGMKTEQIADRTGYPVERVEEELRK